MKCSIVRSKDLGRDWRPDRHIKVDGLPLFMIRRLDEIRAARARAEKQIERWNEEEREILAQREKENP